MTASVELLAVDGKKLLFSVHAHDGVDLIAQGTHERYVIDRPKFDAQLDAKKAARSAA